MTGIQEAKEHADALGKEIFRLQCRAGSEKARVWLDWARNMVPYLIELLDKANRAEIAHHLKKERTCQ